MLKLILCSTLICLFIRTSSAKDVYTFPKFNVSDPSCKYFVSRIISLDDQFLGLISMIFPYMETFAMKYDTWTNNQREKRDVPVLNNNYLNHIQQRLGKRDIPSISKLLGLLSNKAVISMFNMLGNNFLKHIMYELKNSAGPMGDCVEQTKAFLKYWHGILKTILSEHRHLFFDV